MPRKKDKASPAAPPAPASLPAKGAAKAKRGKQSKERRTDPRRDTRPAATAAPAAPPPPKFVPPSDFAFWTDEDHDELTAAWQSLPERRKVFFHEWYTNGFKATDAYVKTYGQDNRSVARICASQILSTPNVIRLRRAIWALTLPPIERMAAVEADALEAESDIDPKLMKTHLMKLSAVKSIREAHGLQPAVNLNLKGKVEHEHKGGVSHTVEIGDDLKGLLNGGG